MLKNKAALVVAPLAILAAQVRAAVPAEAEAVFTGAVADFKVVAGYGFTAMAAILGGLIVFKLVKKVANKATS